MPPDPATPPGQHGPARSLGSGPGGARAFWFRLLAAALPLLFILLLEAVLRLSGYGYPASFFLERRQPERTTMLEENPKFGWRFFPPAIARAPLPLRLELRKPPGTVRVFLFGESAAMGDPEPAYGFGRQLQRLLQARHPAQRIEVINVAMTAINSHVIRAIAADCASRQGDLWLIYAGNNEVVGPFGAGTVFGAQAPPLLSVRAILAAKRWRLGQLLAHWSLRHKEPTAWAGMELFVHNQVPARDPRLERVYANFAANLAAIINLGRNSGAKILLSTVAVNLKDCPPFASVHRSGLTAAILQKWEEAFALGRREESDRHFDLALAAYQQAARLDDRFAELIFRRARCELALGNSKAAQEDFVLARDLDALRFRADSRINEIIRNAAQPGVVLVDAERNRALLNSTGVAGDEEFCDHVHPNFNGNYQLARLLATDVEKQLFPSTSGPGAWLTQDEIARQLAFTDFDRRRVGEEMRARLQQPPFSNQSNYQERDRHWQEVLAEPANGADDAVWVYRAALALAPNDWVLRANFGRLLEAKGDKAAAAEQWTQVIEQLPDEPEAYFHLGNLALDAASYDQAAAEFRRTLELRPDSVEALSGLGLVLAAQGRTNQALAQFDRALKLNNHSTAARINRALLLAQTGDSAGAMSEYQKVLELDTNNAAARINLAKLLARQGKTNEALALFSQAVALKPDNPIAQFDFANTLSALGRHAEALTHYDFAVQSQPAFADAQYNLALELARFDRLSEALPHFAEAVRLRPAAAENHFNYGVALAKARRYAEAAHQFQDTLRCQSNYPGAQSMLNRAVQLDSGPMQP